MKSNKAALDLLAAIASMSRGTATVAQWREQARKDLEKITTDHPGPAVAKAAEFANKVADLVLAEFPADYQLCGVRQNHLDTMIAEIGATIEIAFGKLYQTEPTPA
jgi:hypothetical protein